MFGPYDELAGCERMEANPRNHGKPFEVEKKPASQDHTSTTPRGRAEQASFKVDSGAEKDVIRKAYPYVDRLTI